ncbi:hypothetical protein F5Y15DRAFT_424530 [Xylariaceae sp. FL0016]|nr:hypothetical protein F5Y15DRAFT_424530 [Xylariaceae sp. FL0016]
MSSQKNGRKRQVITFFTASLIIYIVFFIYSTWPNDIPLRPKFWTDPHSRAPESIFPYLSLDEKQCEATFPGLVEDIKNTVALGPFDLTAIHHNSGPLQAQIKNGQLSILHAEKKGTLSKELVQSRTAALHQIHRAILTSPGPLPDTVFSLNIQDQAYGTAWSYARPAFAAPVPSVPYIHRAFLMPHFAYWNWPLPFIGSLANGSAAVDAIERALPFSRKDPRVVWRGTARFNGAHYPHLRQDLLDATRDAAWADVQALDNYDFNSVSGDDHGNDEDGSEMDSRSPAMMIEDFCRYKYVLYTDGITYSGRLQFLQMCGSVLITAPIAWLQHTTHLVRPLFSSDLDLGSDRTWSPSEAVNQTWQDHYPPEEANAVFVSPDWSDLEATVQWLEENPHMAEGIAGRQRELYVGKGYFSPAAEVCYWRALIRGWASVVQLDGERWEGQDAISWELFTMTHELYH